jgi:hypothetical protein
VGSSPFRGRQVKPLAAIPWSQVFIPFGLFAAAMLAMLARYSGKRIERMTYRPALACLESDVLSRFIEYIAESAADKRLSIFSPS